MSNDAHILPACQKCRMRKVRCDRKAPKCSSCAKSHAACIIVDQVTGEQYARDFIRQLEEQESFLRERISQVVDNETVETQQEEEHGSRGPPTGGSMCSHGGFVGDGSGLGFLHSILSEERWQQERTRILNQLAVRPRILKQPLPPNKLPPLQEAEELINNYFTRFHIHHTFLLREDVLHVFNRVYVAPDTATAQDKFRLLMVFAISATTRYRAGLCTEHPYGYLRAAEAFLRTIPLIKDTEAIQNLLLVARFGMYHHIGISLWEISQVCMRQCIELRLHNKPSGLLDPLTEQHQRRIFWESYVLDRYSSGILGRPFAIAEEEITVPLPVDMNDDIIVASGALSLDLVPSRLAEAPSELSIFICFISLRRISSRIHSTFYSGRKSGINKDNKLQDFQFVGEAYVSFARFRDELNMWRVHVPVFADPKSLYERSDWHDFMYQKDMLLLARGAMYTLHSSSFPGSSVATDILEACYMSASQVIQLYASLMDKRAITWTRSYFQVIFTAGLTAIYCILLQTSEDTGLHDSIVLDSATETLYQCSRILTHFKENMPDAGSFAAVFDRLRDECINERGRRAAQDRDTASSRPATQGVAYMSTLANNSQEQTEQPIDRSTHLFEFQQHEVNPTDYDLNLSFTEDLMTQLEAGIGEYAWGNLPTEANFWDQFSFA